MTVEVNDQGQLVMRERIDMSQGDVILRCEDGSVPCHKVVLAALSPMLETILREVTEEEPPTIILPDIKLRTLTTFLTEFYLNSVSDVNTEMTRLLGFKLRDSVLTKKISTKELSTKAPRPQEKIRKEDNKVSNNYREILPVKEKPKLMNIKPVRVNLKKISNPTRRTSATVTDPRILNSIKRLWPDEAPVIEEDEDDLNISEENEIDYFKFDPDYEENKPPQNDSKMVKFDRSNEEDEDSDDDDWKNGHGQVNSSAESDSDNDDDFKEEAEEKPDTLAELNKLTAFQDQVKKLVKPTPVGVTETEIDFTKKSKKPSAAADKLFTEDTIWQYVTNLTCRSGKTSQGSVKCNFCDKVYGFKVVHVHLETVHGIKEARSIKCHGSSYGENRKKGFWREHCDQDPNSKLRCICRLCGKNLSKISAPKHLATKHQLSEQWYLCSHCGKSYYSKESQRNCELRHTNSYQYYCNECGKGFLAKYTLENHMKTIHCDERPFQCIECGKSFKTKFTLNLHEKIHCNQTSVNRGLMKKMKERKEMRKIYTDEEVAQKPHYCEICFKRFSKEDYFKIHMKIHSGEIKIKCDYCNKEFQDRCYLKRHIRDSHTHKDEKPFKCGECGRAFKHKKSLKIHSVIHTNVNPYECQDCGDTFRSPNAYHYHYCQTFMNSSM